MVMFIVVDGKVVGFIVVVDIIKEIFCVVVKCLKDMGLDVIMMIGDN